MNKAEPVQQQAIALSRASSGGGVIGLIWAFVGAAWLLVGAGYLAVQGDDWYAASLQSYALTEWYAWPWNWPGPHLVEHAFTALGISAWDALSDPGMRMFLGAPRFTLAGAINAIVAMLPLLALSLLLQFVRAGKAARLVSR